MNNVTLPVGINSPNLQRIFECIVESANKPLEKMTGLTSAAYTDWEFYNWEVENIFKKRWLCVGHISQIPNIGDYFNLDLLKEPLVVVRGSDREIRVLSRVCIHRGMDIMPSACDRTTYGNRRSFICPYHHWSYSTNGQLLNAPEMQNRPEFDCSDYHLHEFRTEIWQGFIFMTFDSSIESVHDTYAGLLPYIERWQMSQLEMVVNLNWECSFNWKVLVENFMEAYHHLGTHHKTLEPIIPASQAWTEAETPNHIVCHLPVNKSILNSEEKLEELLEFKHNPNLKSEDFQEYTIFLGEPNFLLAVRPDLVYWYFILPDGPNQITLHTTILVYPESSEDDDYQIKLDRNIELLKEFHLEDMEVCTAVQVGMSSQTYQPGPLSHLEMPICFFQRYLARQIKQTKGKFS